MFNVDSVRPLSAIGFGFLTLLLFNKRLVLEPSNFIGAFHRQLPSGPATAFDYSGNLIWGIVNQLGELQVERNNVISSREQKCSLGTAQYLGEKKMNVTI